MMFLSLKINDCQHGVFAMLHPQKGYRFAIWVGLMERNSSPGDEGTQQQFNRSSITETRMTTNASLPVVSVLPS